MEGLDRHFLPRRGHRRTGTARCHSRKRFFKLKDCAHVMEGRPDTRPGAFKQEANQAGPTVFVAPDLVTGTLAQGFGLCRSLETPFQRAVFMMFLIAEVHPGR